MMPGLLTPVIALAGTSVGGNVYRKQLLPLGAINYEGRTLTFDRDALEQVAASVRGHAFDTVPVMLADATNSHTMAPEATAGEVLGVEITDDGLDVIVRLTERAAAVVDANPRVGVSAHLIPGHTRQDGTTATTWPWALQHALVCTQPYVAGMRPWTPEQAASLSSGSPTTDLSGQAWQALTTGGTVPLTDQQLALLAAAGMPYTDDPAPEAAAPPPTAVVTGADTVTKPDGDALLERAVLDGGSLTDDDYAALEAWADAQGEPEPVEIAAAPPVLAGANLSTSVSADAIELAGAKARLAAVEAQLAASAWTNERTNLISAGIPPAMVDAAAPVLASAHPNTVNLAGGQSTDAKAVLRAVLLAGKGVIPVGALTGSISTGQTGDGTGADNPIYKAWAAARADKES